MTCPVCGSESEGRFCSNCGATLTTLSCPSCESEVPAGARFCPRCGHSLGANPERRTTIAWIAAGATVAAVAAVLLVRLTSPSTFAGASSGSEAPAMAPAPDISSMSPKERATRLYNRVMTAAENNDTAQVRFFGPMAVQAYALMGDLDPDAHYHLGMIHLVNGEYAAAGNQADSIARSGPKNLLATALRVEIARRKGDKAGQSKAYRALLANYDGEMATGNPDYADHREALERLHTEAQKAEAVR